jgi:hypothetical protein
MKYFKTCATLCIVGSIALLHDGNVRAQSSKTLYSLKTVESNPIPKDEHFRLWRDVALKQCSDAKTRYNLTTEQCVVVVGQRADACASKLSSSVPSVIKTTAAARDIGRNYLHCATPYYFCNGVEVKTEEEVRAKCK